MSLLECQLCCLYLGNQEGCLFKSSCREQIIDSGLIPSKMSKFSPFPCFFFSLWPMTLDFDMSVCSNGFQFHIASQFHLVSYLWHLNLPYWPAISS